MGDGTETWLTIAIATAAGASIWVLSLLLTNHPEAWDAGGGYYPVVLVVAGLLAGVLAPKPLWAHYVGAVLGQLAYMLIFLPTGPLIVVGINILLIAGASSSSGSSNWSASRWDNLVGKTLGDRLTELRHRLGLSQKDLLTSLAGPRAGSH